MKRRQARKILKRQAIIAYRGSTLARAEARCGPLYGLSPLTAMMDAFQRVSEGAKKCADELRRHWHATAFPMLAVPRSAILGTKTA